MVLSTAVRDHPSEFVRAALAAEAEVHRSLGEPARAQQEVFQQIVRANQDTSFGREHGFDQIHDLAEYRRRVPVRSYDQLAGWIARAAAGEEQVLTAEPIRDFIKSAGSTSASKLIPLTQGSRLVGRRRILSSWALAYHQDPETFDRDDTTLNLLQNRPREERTAGGGRANFATAYITDSEILRKQPGVAAPWAALPPGLSLREATLFRLRIAAEHQVRCVTAGHPAVLLSVARDLAEEGPRLIEDIRTGRVLGAPARPPAPALADRLAEAMAQDGRLEPRHLWPELRILSCWTGGQCGSYLSEVRQRYGTGAALLPANIVASESGVAQYIDHLPGAALCVYAALFEFLPPEVEAEGHPETLSFDQLEAGREYQLVITTFGGLYRYALQDVVRVVGWFGAVPRLEFIARLGVPHSFGIERLTEYQVAAAVTRALARGGHSGIPYTLCPIAGAPPRYALAAEVLGLSARCAEDLANALDQELAVSSILYALERESGRLGPAELVALPAQTLSRYRARRVAQGAPELQAKEAVIQRSLDALETLLSLAGPGVVRGSAG
jgi:hypothetical protein